MLSFRYNDDSINYKINYNATAVRHDSRSEQQQYFVLFRGGFYLAQTFLLARLRRRRRRDSFDLWSVRRSARLLGT